MDLITRLEEVRERQRIRQDASDEGVWVTMHGAHVLLGEAGELLAGAGGALAGKEFKDAKSTSRKSAVDKEKKKEAAAKKKAEAERKKAEEAKRKEEEKKKAEEARRKEEEARKKAEAEAKRKAEEARRKAEEEARKKAEEEARKKAEEEAKRKAEEERRKAEEEAKAKEYPPGTSYRYDKDRVENANVYKDGESLEVYKDQIEQCWKDLDYASKEALFSYTTGSSFVNEPLHGIYYRGYKTDDGASSIDRITKAIDKCTVPQDTIGYHSMSASGFRKLTGVDPTPRSLDRITGSIARDNGFVSCTAEKSPVFKDHPVVLDIFIPKGAKGLYAEPFASYGKGAASAGWNGKVTQKSVSEQNELILQRGGAYRITGHYVKDGKTHVKMELVDQDYSSMTRKLYSKYCK